MSNPQHAGTRSRWAVWSAGFVVVVAAGAATAHGLYEVALGSGTPAGIAWLYPVITDGLALVAYAATTRLIGSGRRYAWTVVVLAAGLSGLAQATYLAGTVGAAPTGLRFGVGAWPAVAAAIAAHLLFLIGTAAGDERPDPWSELDATTVQGLSRPGVQTAECPSVQLDGHPNLSTGVQPEPRPALSAGADDKATELHRGLSPRDRALAAGRDHERRHGALPSVRELEAQAQVSRGTAHNALQELRAHANGSHVIDENRDESPNQ